MPEGIVNYCRNTGSFVVEIRKLRYEFACPRRLELHHDVPTITFRGAFGYALAQFIAKYAGIPDLQNQVALYKSIFMPQLDEEEHNRGKDLSRPFVLRGFYSRPDQKSFLLDVLIFGSAAKYDLLFDKVIELVAGMGLGKGNRVCRFEKVSAITLPLADPDPEEYLSVRFFTPCSRLKSQGVIYYDEIPFPALFSRLADRVNELIRLYGDENVFAEGKELGELKMLAAEILHRKISGGRYAANRTSGRTGQTMRLDGFLGEMGYRGDFTPFREYLRYLPYVNVGRFNVFGCGWCQMHYIHG